MSCEFRIGNQTFPAWELADRIKALPLEVLRQVVPRHAPLPVNDKDVRFSFAGRSAKTAALDSWTAAQDALERGAYPERVRRETGWFLGVDGYWRFEIPDDEAKLKLQSQHIPKEWGVHQSGDGYAATARAADFLDHPKLFAAYPDLEDMPVMLRSDGGKGGSMRKGGGITLNTAIAEDAQAPGEFKLFDPQRTLSTLLHELQHGIQFKEGFATGGDVDPDFARQVKAILANMDDDARRSLFVWNMRNADNITEAREASQLARYALMQEGAERLQGYADRDSPSGVMRLIRNEMQWIYADEFRSNEVALQLQRDFYRIPKPGKMAERNQFLSEFARRGAQMLLDRIPPEVQQRFASDKRSLKGMIKALERTSQKAREKLAPRHALEREAKRATAAMLHHENSTAFDIYHALAGEVEARNVQDRQHLNEDQRREQSPLATASVPEDQQIVLLGREIQAPLISRSIEKPADATETEAFKRWFGDSKVVDADGKPLVVYHGTMTQDITEFRPAGGRDGEWQEALAHFKKAQTNNERYGYMGFRSGSFFSPKPEYAENYTGENQGLMYPVYIKAENPIYWDQVTRKVHGVDPDKTPDALILHTNGDINEIAVIDPLQVKSATGNNGDFDPGNADIRFSRRRLPRAILGDTLGALQKHPDYFAAKTGDFDAAMRLAADVVTLDLANKLEGMEADAVLGVITDEESGVNAIPTAAAVHLAKRLDLAVAQGIHKKAGIKRTQMDGLDRVFRHPSFAGEVKKGARYILLDDTLTQGGTFAALAEHIESNGGSVAAVVALTGKNYSSDLNLSDDTLTKLRAQLSHAEPQFQQATGRSFDQLTESEARYLANFKPQSAIHERIAEALERGMAPEGGPDAGRQDSVTPPDRAGDDGARFSRRRMALPTSSAPWDSPSASKWDDMVYRMQDKHVDTKRVMQAIEDTSGAISDDLDVYLNERLFHGRSAKRTQDFVNDELNPLVKDMASAGLKIEDLDEYLHARHAKEANAVIAQRNPDMPDGGSGMTDAAADDYFAKLKPEDRKALEGLAARVDAIMKDTRELYVDYELEGRDTVDGWGQMFQHYVPLMREDQEGRPGTGQGISIKGRETKGRTGSSRKVVDILANIALQRERVIVRGEKNRVAQALVGLAQTNPNAEFWAVDQPKVEQVFNPKTGLVENRTDPMWKNRPNAVAAKMRDEHGNVQEHAVVFNERDERAMRMAEALKNLDAAQLEGLWGASAKVTRYFSAINTQYNPVFGIVNAMRDVQSAALGLSSTPLKGQQRKVLAGVLPALGGIWADLRASRKGGKAQGQWAALWDEFQNTGGQTGYRDLYRNSSDRAAAIQKVLTPTGWMDSKWGKVFTVGGALKLPLATAQKIAAPLFDMLSDYNEAIENGVRLSAFKAALDQGMSKERAAALAKNLTVDFNKKGQVAQQAGALYAFFNAAMQGTARIGEVLLEMEPGKPKTMRLSGVGKKIVGGGMLLGVMQALAMAAAGFDDENPPDFVRERALVIPTFGLLWTPEKGFLSIPMPMGFHVIPNLGRHAAEFAMGGFANPAQRAIKLMALFADAFNPIGNAGMSVQTLTPTILDPLVALTENKDFAGRPIAKESRNSAIPGHALGRDTSTAVGKAISEGINWLSGGNQYVSGALSPTPDQIDYLIGQVLGGVGREYSKVEQSLKSAVTGEELATHKIPLVGRLIGNADGQSSQSSSYYANIERVNRVKTEAKAMAEDGKAAEAREFLQSKSERYLVAQANTAERQLTRLRKQKHELIKDKAPADQVRRVEEQITQVMQRFNNAVEDLKQRA